MGGFKGLKRCSHCDYSHKLSAQVRRHERQAHGENALQCTVLGCGQRVPYNRLARHIRQCHSDALRAIDISQPLDCALTEETQTDELAVLGQKEKRMEEQKKGKNDRRRKTKEDEEEKRRKKGKEDVQETGDGTEGDKESAQAHGREENGPSSVVSSSSPSASASQLASSLSVGVVPTAQLALGQHECAMCGQRKPTREALRRHIARVHEKRYTETKREKRHHCVWEGCGKSFTTRGGLEDHVNGHTGNCPFSCDHCKRSFLARAEFLRHLRKYHAVSIRQMDRQIEQIADLTSE